MSIWNYVATAQKPSVVKLSRVGNFTAPQDKNLVIAKSTRLEIHRFRGESLELLLDVQIYGRIGVLLLFRPQGEQQDLLFISTEKQDFCILGWDEEATQLITRAKKLGSTSYKFSKRGQIGDIDPHYTMIAVCVTFHVFQVIELDNNGIFKDIPNRSCFRFILYFISDIKFLYGTLRPTIAILYQDTANKMHLKTLEVIKEQRELGEGPWYVNDLEDDASFLIPLPMPLGGVVVIGKETIAYHNGSVSEAIRISPAVTETYERIDESGFTYLLGNKSGFLHLLHITHENERFTGLSLTLIGRTSEASTISRLDNGIFYLGGSSEDSLLVKLTNLQAGVPDVQILEKFTNIGPIEDFCVVNSEGQVGDKIITCSGGSKQGSLCVLQKGIAFTEWASVEMERVVEAWSLRACTSDIYDTFIVLSFIGGTRIFAVNSRSELEQTEFEGFNSEAETLICGNVTYNQIVQVVAGSVKLIDALSRNLLFEWTAPAGDAINVATTNETQVLLATEGGNLFYLEVGKQSLDEKMSVKHDHEISCLNINPVGYSSKWSQFAAVGLWDDITVAILCLPTLQIVAKEDLGGDNILPRCLLFCTFESTSYLLCGVADGRLFTFIFNEKSGHLSAKNSILLGTHPITALRPFFMENAIHVIAESDSPTIISGGGRRRYKRTLLSKVARVCPFNTSTLRQSFAIVTKEDKLIIGSILRGEKLHGRKIPLRERPSHICHQEQSHTFAICSTKYSGSSRMEEIKTRFVHLIDDTNFEIISSFQLDEFERGSAIASCMFEHNDTAYYCVGTKVSHATRASTGRLLVFAVENGQLNHVDETVTEGTVYSLNAFNGKLLAGIDDGIVLFVWTIDDESYEGLQSECEEHVPGQALSVETVGKFILVCDLMRSIWLFEYKPETKEIQKLGNRDFDTSWATSLCSLSEDTYVAAENDYNLYTVSKTTEGETDDGNLSTVGEYHLGESINRLRRCSLIGKANYAESTVFFGTANGTIGVVASLSHDQFLLLDKLRANLLKVINAVGGISHTKWRSFCCNGQSTESRNFVDGDLIELFLDLDTNQREQIADGMNVPAEYLFNVVQDLKSLH